MSFDSQTRNKLQRMVGACRRLLADEFDDQLQGLYGIYAQDGRVLELEKLTSLDDDDHQTATLLRDRINHLTSGMASEKQALAEAVRRVLREQAFTLLNRFAALRMAEERGFVQECVGQGLKSKGFQVFETVARSGLGGAYERYVTFIHGMFDELSLDLGVLFDRWSPFGLLFPRQPALLKFFDLLNDPELKPLWKEDETVGWIYQYFNDEAERKKMREESSAPRNSRELAVRNQFFTPRYVVEFLTDNTLGRIWYEMTRGETKLKEQCRYLVRRPTEIFLKPGEKAPEQPKQDNLSQADLLKQPVHIPHRPIKDPRTILMLDPACGSMHFGLYAFDLFEVIYEEAWELEKRGVEFQPRPPGMLSLQESYGTKEDFLKDVPRLIIEHNLHGIDIDPRCAQIAGLSLWLRAQKAWQRLGLKPAERPAIKRSNIVCAEPMPGEKELLREFVEREFPVEERGVCLRLLESIFDKMQLAGEAGSLLKIEEEIRSAIEDARRQWQTARQRPEFFDADQLATLDKRAGAQQELPAAERATMAADLRSLTSEDFWERIEERIYAALRDYAEQAENGGGFQRRLFAEDAARGFAFIDVCRKRYDVVLMNPPFGDASETTQPYLQREYPDWNFNLFCCFVARALESAAFVGAITDRAYMLKTSYEEFRRKRLLVPNRVESLVDLGWGILDANVEVNLQIFTPAPERVSILNLLDYGDQRSEKLLGACLDASREEWNHREHEYFLDLPNAVISYQLPPWQELARKQGQNITSIFAVAKSGLKAGRVEQFVRLLWEIPENARGTQKAWNYFQNGSPYAPYYYPTVWVLRYEPHWGHIKSVSSSRITGLEDYWRAGLSYGKRTDFIYCYPMPEGQVFSNEGMAVFPNVAEDRYALMAFMNSPTCQALMNLLAGQHKAHSYFNKMSLLSRFQDGRASELAQTILTKLRSVDSINETSLSFANPFSILSSDELNHPITSTVSAVSRAIDEATGCFSKAAVLVAELLGDLEPAIAKTPSWVDLLFEFPIGKHLAALNLLSYGIGVAFGRWDIRYATGEQAAPELPDPFAPLPVCPPGQLQNAQGLPLGKDEVRRMKDEGRWTYPIEIPWDGILVDDPNHPLDIEHGVREVIEIIWSAKEKTTPHPGPLKENIDMTTFIVYEHIQHGPSLQLYSFLHARTGGRRFIPPTNRVIRGIRQEAQTRFRPVARSSRQRVERLHQR